MYLLYIVDTYFLFFSYKQQMKSRNMETLFLNRLLTYLLTYMIVAALVDIFEWKRNTSMLHEII